jgi:hypothetical protein
VRRFAPQLFAQLSCIALALFCSSDLQAQIPDWGAPNRIQDRGWTLDTLRRQAATPRVDQKRRVDRVALRNDFRQLQIVNNNLMKRVFEDSSSAKITNKEIRASLNEIKKLAQRLADRLGIPTSKDKAKHDVVLTAGLLQMDKAIMSFVDNPLFEQLRVYDTELVSQAGKDLSDVVRLAGVLRSQVKDD